MEGKSRFVIKVDKRPRNITLPPRRGKLRMVRKVATRPARFIIGLGKRRLPPQGKLGGPPSNARAYWGRVDEVNQGMDLVAVTLWEHPSGRKVYADLSLNELFPQDPPMEGALLLLHTWMEIHEQNGPTPKRCVEVIPAEVPDETLKKLKEGAEELKKIIDREEGVS